MNPLNPMPTSSIKKEIPSCGCQKCRCHRGLRCRCHDYNALLVLALWDYALMLRARKRRAVRT